MSFALGCLTNKGNLISFCMLYGYRVLRPVRDLRIVCMGRESMDMDEVGWIGRALAFPAVCPIQRMNMCACHDGIWLHDEHRRVLTS